MVSVLLMLMLLDPDRGAASTMVVIFLLLIFVVVIFVVMIFVRLAPSVMAEKTERRRAGLEIMITGEIMITVEELLDLPGYTCRC